MLERAAEQSAVNIDARLAAGIVMAKLRRSTTAERMPGNGNAINVEMPGKKEASIAREASLSSSSSTNPMSLAPACVIAPISQLLPVGV